MTQSGDVESLVERLRACANASDGSSQGAKYRLHEAADFIATNASTLVSLQEENARLRHDAGELVVAQYATSAAEARAERAEAQLKAAREALAAIRELNMSDVDANGHKWANSDLIEQELVAALQPIPEEVGK